jgi:hypothetical protein
MPKQVFWPLAIVVLGLIFLASSMDLLPRDFWYLWPLIAIIVGLGGLLTSDRTEWLAAEKAEAAAAKNKAKQKSSRPARKRK